MNVKENMCIAYVDGASRGNPGPASIGVSLCSSSGEEFATSSQYIGEQTNNTAEYQSLLEALNLAVKHTCLNLKVYADSQLMVRQIQGVYKVKHPQLQKLWKEAMQKIQTFNHFEIEHVKREKNCRADALANLALNER